MILSILTNPCCSHIPIESYPQLAKAILPMVREFNNACDRDEVVIVLKLAADIASSFADGGFGGAGTRQDADEQDFAEPAGR